MQVFSLNYPQWKYKLIEGSAGLASVTWSSNNKHLLTLSELNVCLIFLLIFIFLQLMIKLKIEYLNDFKLFIFYYIYSILSCLKQLLLDYLDSGIYMVIRR